MGRLFLLIYCKQVACCHDEQYNRVNFAHTHSPPFGGKIPPQNFSCPGRFVSIIHTIIQQYKQIFLGDINNLAASNHFP